ncbi:MAG: signal peptidase II [Candidatus Rokuibacteriota bacterium]
MTLFVLGLIAVPLLDQALKLLVRRRLRRRSFALGPAGRVQAIEAQIWMLRAPGPWTPRMMWTLWAVGAGALTVVSGLVPSCAWASGLVVGGALSHAAEVSLRGSVCDYVCLRFWPAFDLADVALTVGAAGTLIEVVAAIPRP